MIDIIILRHSLFHITNACGLAFEFLAEPVINLFGIHLIRRSAQTHPTVQVECAGVFLHFFRAVETVVNATDHIHIHRIPVMTAERTMYFDTSGSRVIFRAPFKAQQINDIFNGNAELGHFQSSYLFSTSFAAAFRSAFLHEA